MPTQHVLLTALKAELKAAGVTYAQLAVELGLAESSVKRLFAKGDLTLERIETVLQVLKMDFAELAQRVVEAQPLRRELTAAQEASVVADRKLLLVAICVLSQWTLEQMLGTYAFTEAELIGHMAQLDRLGVIELRPHNRYRLMLAKGFRWRADGPVMHFFRQNVVPEYFDGGFAGEGETLMLVHGQLSPAHAAALVERLERVGLDFAQQHLADQKLAPERRRAYTLVVGQRSWLFSAFADLKRPGLEASEGGEKAVRHIRGGRPATPPAGASRSRQTSV